jgi:hypothetical protein
VAPSESATQPKIQRRVPIVTRDFPSGTGPRAGEKGPTPAHPSPHCPSTLTVRRSMICHGRRATRILLFGRRLFLSALHPFPAKEITLNNDKPHGPSTTTVTRRIRVGRIGSGSAGSGSGKESPTPCRPGNVEIRVLAQHARRLGFDQCKQGPFD